MRKDNKKFVRNIIIVSVIGLIMLMIVLFMVLHNYLGEQEKETYIQTQQLDEQVDESISLSESKMILVNQVSDNRMIGYDIKSNAPFNKKIIETVKVNDAYGKIFPIREIKTGDIVEVAYDSDKDAIISINKSTKVESWKQISGVTVDEANCQLKIGGTSYNYTDNTLILDSQGKEVQISNIGPFDIVSVQGMDQTVWSIIINAASASINMEDLPTQNGQIEIDNSRLILFRDVTEPIKVIPGTHKLVIKMYGYETICETLNLVSGENYKLSLKEAAIAYTVVKPYVSGQVTDYTIKVGGNTYNPSDEIRLPQGEYQVEVNAEGYEKWVRLIKLEKDIYSLGIRLVSIQEEDEEEETEETVTGDSRTVTLSTDPLGAKVYIDGALKGETPYTISLTNGSYTILFEKAGYTLYSTNILLDGSNDQSAFLYRLESVE